VTPPAGPLVQKQITVIQVPTLDKSRDKANKAIVEMSKDELMHAVVSILHFCCYSIVFSAKCNIYISRLCYDVSVRLSVRLSVTFVHCGHRLQWIPDIFACLDRWMSLLLTDNASPGSSDGMLPGFLVEEGRGMEKLVIVAI